MEDEVVVEEVEEIEVEPQETEKAPEKDWQSFARKHENAARRATKERDALAAQLKEREDADKSEQEKAIAAAREEGEKVARTAADKDRRADRLENAAIKVATKGVQIEDEDGKKVAIKFADSEDAVTYLERAIRRGDLDEDDIFTDDGKIKQDEVNRVLTELLVSKPHLAASSGAKPKVTGSADGGKGSGGAKSMDDLTPEEWLNKIRKVKV